MAGSEPYAQVDSDPVLGIDPLVLFAIIADGPAEIAQYQSNAHYGETRPWCASVNRIADATHRACLKESRENGPVKAWA
jgi:hypothetical protein